jgi:uncharacterized BrkB/YihY/UPF0761 family membrane protein
MNSLPLGLPTVMHTAVMPIEVHTVVMHTADMPTAVMPAALLAMLLCYIADALCFCYIVNTSKLR